jgi:hypothetical protein
VAKEEKLCVARVNLFLIQIGLPNFFISTVNPCDLAEIHDWNVISRVKTCLVRKYKVAFFSLSRTPHETSWGPVLWAVSLLQSERASGRFKVEATIFSNIINSFEYLENCNRRIFNHGWVNFPYGNRPLMIEILYLLDINGKLGNQIPETFNDWTNLCEVTEW